MSPGVDLFALSDLCTPWCLHVVATLRIAEHIEAGATGIESLAAAAQCDPYVLQSVLEHLVDKGVFTEPEPHRFGLNETSQQLLHPGMRLGFDLNGIGGRMAHAWGTLLNYVRTGAPAYHEYFGRPFWEDLEAHPEVRASFDDLIGMMGHGTPNGTFDISGGWHSIHTVVDVGGGTGAMLAEVLRARPHVRGILVDRPQTAARSAETFAAAGVAERVGTSAQSFFDPLPPGADLYLLRGVLNDWPDHEAKAILERCAEAASPNGRVVVLKSVAAEGKARGLTIEMVLLAGKHRDLPQFRQLAREAGLDVVAAGESGGYFVVECRPAGGDQQQNPGHEINQ